MLYSADLNLLSGWYQLLCCSNGRDDLLGAAIHLRDAQILVQHIGRFAVTGEHDGLPWLFKSRDGGRVVYLHRDAIDFRKNINGLASLVEHGLGLDAFAHAVFVFGNRRKDRIKILGWDRNGFWLLQKRLENARFIWPVKERAVAELTAQQLHWLLDGIDLSAMRGHATVTYQKAA